MSARFTIEVSAGRKAIFLGDYSAFPITHNLSEQLALYSGQDKRTRTRAPPTYRLESLVTSFEGPTSGET